MGAVEIQGTAQQRKHKCRQYYVIPGMLPPYGIAGATYDFAEVCDWPSLKMK